jgi:spectinomycin phosphotransferase
MIQKPNLKDESIVAALRDHYGVVVVALEFLQLGNDSHAWVYRVSADAEKPYFLKVRKGELNKASLIVPRYIKDHGIEQVVAPLPTNTGALWVNVDSFALILYPFVEGGMGAVVGMSDFQTIEFGAIVRKIHALPISEQLSAHMQKETYASKWMPLVQYFQATVAQRVHKDESELEFLSIWREKRGDVQKIIDRTLQLGRQFQSLSLPFVLCHADIHTYNVLVGQDGKLFIVDWDETVIAPKERDLMHIGSANTKINNRSREVELFYQGYGNTEVNPVAFAYYRYEWVVQELGAYADQIFLTADVGDATKAKALYYFRGLFAPGDVVDVAYATEANLPHDFQS